MSESEIILTLDELSDLYFDVVDVGRYYFFLLEIEIIIFSIWNCLWNII